MKATNRTRPARFAAGGLLLIAATCLPMSASAQVADNFGTVYGLGVQAYFAGDHHRAERRLSEAIAARPEDPRPYYFRGLAHMRLGRQDEARQDMQFGAMLEARRPATFDIGTTLQRVQGGARLTLEEFRRQARRGATGHQPTADRPLVGRQPRNAARSEQFAARDAAVLRRPANLPLEALADTVELPDAVTLAMSGRLEAAQRALQPSQPQPETVVRQSAGDAAPTSDEENPFADDDAPPIEADVENPFEAASGTPTSSASANEKIEFTKLVDILGRVLEKVGPLGSMKQLSGMVPAMPPAPAGTPPPGAGTIPPGFSSFGPGEAALDEPMPPSRETPFEVGEFTPAEQDTDVAELFGEPAENEAQSDPDAEMQDDNPYNSTSQEDSLFGEY